MKAKRLDAQDTPRRLNIAVANIGNPAPKSERTNVVAASADAALKV